MATNPYGKSRNPGDPHFCFMQDGWTWRVLKLYKAPANTLKDPYARAYCFVTSPFCEGGEYGDVYVKDIPGMRERMRLEVSRAQA